jgi:gamma-glutamylcyclotransferase (GGCT)/AIG2-like uncharacterized protein YtfP
MDPDLLFAYGTLRKGFCPPELRVVLERESEHLGAATFQGMLFHLGAYPGVVHSPDPQHQVQGDLYRLRESKQILAALDAYEGCDANRSETGEFARRVATVRLPSGEAKPAWIYVYVGPVEGLKRIPSGVWSGAH